MLAARLNVRTHELLMEELAVPEPGPGHVRIAVAASGVCLSDVHLIDGSLNPVRLDGEVVTLGHEVAGTVDAVGAGVTGWAPGARALLQAGQYEGPDVHTRGVDYDGGWAEYALARVDTLVPIPDDLPFEQACFIPDAVSTPWAAITHTAGVRPGQAVGVWGVGGLGAHAVALLRLVGAAPIIAVDPLEAARARALTLGADVALDPADAGFAALLAAAAGGGLAHAFDLVGVSAAREQAMACLGPAGALTLVGMAATPFTIGDSAGFNYFGRRVLGHYGSEPADVTQLVRLVEHGRLDLAGSVSEVLPLSEAAAAVEHLTNKTGNPIRIVLKP